MDLSIFDNVCVNADLKKLDFVFICIWSSDLIFGHQCVPYLCLTLLFCCQNVPGFLSGALNYSLLFLSTNIFF